MKSLYALCVGEGWVSTADFWQLTPGEVWWLIEAKKPKTGMGENVRQELLEMLDKALAEG